MQGFDLTKASLADRMTYENNFVRTYEGMHWFAYFRLYGPTEAYFDGSWPMHDVRRVER